MNSTTTAIILGAGKGSRMKGPKPKVLHEIMGVTLVEYVIIALNSAQIEDQCLIIAQPEEDFDKIAENEVFPTKTYKNHSKIDKSFTVDFPKELISLGFAPFLVNATFQN